MIEQPSGGGDEDVDAAAQGLDLIVHADAAVNGLRAQRHVPAIVAEALGDLGGKLARGRQHQGTRRATGSGVCLEPREHRDGECRGLAGAGLRGREQIATGHDQWNGPLLNGCGRLMTEIGNGAQ